MSYREDQHLRAIAAHAGRADLIEAMNRADEYVEELIDRERTRDLMGTGEIHHLDGDRTSLELSNLEVRESKR